jgi:hypothetical protein
MDSLMDNTSTTYRVTRYSRYLKLNTRRYGYVWAWKFASTSVRGIKISKMVGLALDTNGEGRIEFHKEYTDRIDILLGGLGLDMSAPLYRDFGRSTTAVSDVSAHTKTGPDILELVKNALQNAGFEVGNM